MSSDSSICARDRLSRVQEIARNVITLNVVKKWEFLSTSECCVFAPGRYDTPILIQTRKRKGQIKRRRPNWKQLYT